MVRRIRGLEDVDALSVPLPYGTEVVTRVDRIFGERQIPRGAIGRVARADGDRVDVHLVGVGDVQYLREELVPRRAGQLRFAHRRDIAWSALRPCVVLEALVGSRAWGLADDASDTDRRGVFVLPFPWTTGLPAPPEDLVSADGSLTYWEAGKAVRQALRADPNTLEVLLAGEVEAVDPMGEWLLEARDAFVSAEIYASFGRYALSQAKKLEQSLRLARHRALVLVWLREEPPPALDDVAARLADEARVEAPTPADRRLRAKEYVKQLYHSMHDQGLLPEANFDALLRFARSEAGAFDLPRELRPKNAYNLLRLVATAVDWLRTGRPAFVVAEPLRSRLLAIKRGEVALDAVIEEASSWAAELEAARRATTLPPHGDVGRADAVLRRIRGEAARRWVAQAPGPFGRDAPPFPEAEWDD